MKRVIIGTVLILGGMLSAASADTWVFRDIQRPNGHDRSMAAKRLDGRRCGAAKSGRWFTDDAAPNMQQCMVARGWALDHVIPDPPSVHARNHQSAPPAPIDTSNDDALRRQQDFDNTQQMINQQQMIDQQQIDNQQMQDQQQLENQRRYDDVINGR